MSKILEIFGKAINIDTARIIWHWLGMSIKKDGFAEDKPRLTEILDLINNLKYHLADEKISFYEIDFPSSIYCQTAKAIIALNRNQLEYAISIFKQAYQDQPFNTMVSYSLGYCHERIGDIDNAVNFYQDCLKFKKYLQLPRERLGAIYLKKGRLDDAIVQYTELCREYPEDTSFYVLLGYLHLYNQNYQKAVETFQQGIMMHPDNYQMHGYLDEIDKFIAQNDFEEAIEAIGKKHQEYGEIPELHIKMSEIYYKRGEINDAIWSLKEATKIQPNNMQATIKLATLYLNTHDYASSAQQFTKALEMNDEIVDSYVGLAKAQLFDKKNDNFKETLSLACAIQQNSNLLYGESSSLQHLSAKNQKSKDSVTIEEIIKLHLKKIASEPENSDLLYKTGLIIMASGDLNSAKKYFENTLESNPFHFRSLSKLVICENETNDFQKAVNLLSVDTAIDQDTIELHYKTALLFCNENNFENAVNKLNLSLENNFTQAGIADNISVILENLGLIDRAGASFVRLERICG